jgi:glycosyltransferase involved in cell wall biosynthesis
MNKRVLMIAYLFPPIANSGTQRPLKFAKYLPAFGWEPIILTADRAPDDRIDVRLLNDIPPGVRVIRVPMLNERVGDFVGGLAPWRAAAARIAASVSWRLRGQWQQPDLYALWRPPARRAALRAFRDIGFDAVFATGFPWTSLLIGRDVSRQTGRALVADFRDPWAADDLYGSADRCHGDALSLERSVIRQASAVISVSDTMTRSMTLAHRDAERSKFVTISNGYDPEDLEVPAPPTHDRFRIVYTGVWKPGYTLDALYDVIARLARSAPELVANIEVVAAGFTPGYAESRGLSRYVTEVGVVSHQAAVSLMYSADLLYLPNPGGSRQQWCLPGKIFEYLATGRPVLALTDPEGEAGRLVQQIGGGVVVSPNDPDGLERMIAAALARTLTMPAQRRGELEAFERPALARRLAAVLDSVTHNPQTHR